MTGSPGFPSAKDRTRNIRMEHRDEEETRSRGTKIEINTTGQRSHAPSQERYKPSNKRVHPFSLTGGSAGHHTVSSSRQTSYSQRRITAISPEILQPGFSASSFSVTSRGTPTTTSLLMVRMLTTCSIRRQGIDKDLSKASPD